MPWVDEERVKRAKEIDLLTYLQQNEPQELVKSKYGTDENRTKTHSSLVISKGLWVHNRTGQGGKSAVGFLIKMRGMGFVDAVEAVSGALGIAAHSAGTPIRGDTAVSSSLSLPVEQTKPQSQSSPQSQQQSSLQPQPPKWTFYPPKPQHYSNKAVSYLQKRGISPEVINRAMQEGMLYESRYYNPESKYHNIPVCVFAGKDETGKIVYAALRGIDTDFKIDKAGSNKCYNFTLPAKDPNSRHLLCFEAPIDLLSHATLMQKRGGLVASDACCSTAQPGIDFDSHRLSLGGISSVALISFLERNPQITRIMLHLDLDAAGIAAAREIKAQLRSDSRFKHIRVSYNPPRGAKDYNEALCRVVGLEREQRQSQRQSQPHK